MTLPVSFAREMSLTSPPPAERYRCERARDRAKARRAKRALDASFDAAAAGVLAEISASSSKSGVAALPEAGAADPPATSAARAAPCSTITPKPRAASPLAFAKLWAGLPELRDGMSPYEEEKLIKTIQAFLAGQLPLDYWTRVVNALAEAKRGAGAAYG
jgi:hypothetical protein